MEIPMTASAVRRTRFGVELTRTGLLCGERPTYGTSSSRL